MSIDPADERKYIGSRSCKCLPKEDTKYFGSYKDKSFKPQQKIILKVFRSREEAFKHEIYLHFILDVAVSNTFANRARVTTTGFTWAGQHHSKETIERLRIASRNMSEETKEKIRQKNKNKKLSPWHLERLKLANTGRKHSLATKEKIKAKALGKRMSKETRRKIGVYNKDKWINRPDQSKVVVLQNIKTKEIKSFVSQKEAVRVLALHQAAVNRVALGKQYSTGGWILFLN
jgi:post-segregation antitoxin (ccd killing protein)